MPSGFSSAGAILASRGRRAPRKPPSRFILAICAGENSRLTPFPEFAAETLLSCIVVRETGMPPAPDASYTALRRSFNPSPFPAARANFRTWPSDNRSLRWMYMIDLRGRLLSVITCSEYYIHLAPVGRDREQPI